MPRINWNAGGSRYYEAGVDRGVLYVGDSAGVPWTGLTSVVEKPSGGDPKGFYIDGVKYLNVPSADEFQATLTAFTYPNEFAVCDGTARIHSGLFATQQPRKKFSFSYRTRIGNELDGPDHGYKIHLVYNALATPSQRSYKSLGDSGEATDFSWDISTRPPAISGYKRTAHLEIDTRYTNPMTMSAIEDFLYGSDSGPAKMPTLADLIEIFEANAILTITDNGDDTFTASGPDSVVRMIDSETYKITSDSIIFIDENTYTISSL